jgi:hypothetical protein
VPSPISSMMRFCAASSASALTACRCLRCLDVESAQQPLGDLPSGGGRQDVMGAAALGDGAAEQSLAQRARQQRADAEGAGGLAGDGNLAWVAAEAGDVVLHPLQGRDLIEQTDGAGVGERRVEGGQVGEAEGAEPVVDADHDDVAVQREAGAVVPGHRALTVAVAAAVNPYQHRPACVVGGWGAHVEAQAVLVPAYRRVGGQAAGGRLRGGRPESGRRAHVAPGLGGLGRPEAA